MSRLFTPRNLTIAGAVAAAVYIIPSTSARKLNPLNTTAVQSVEDRYTSGGGSPTHTPAVATRRGSSEQTQSPQEMEKGIGSEHYKDNITSQRPDKDSRSNELSKKWYGQNTGSEEGR